MAETVDAVRSAILEASRVAQLLEVKPGEAGRAKSVVLTKLDEARLWLADLRAIESHGARP